MLQQKTPNDTINQEVQTKISKMFSDSSMVKKKNGAVILWVFRERQMLHEKEAHIKTALPVIQDAMDALLKEDKKEDHEGEKVFGTWKGGKGIAKEGKCTTSARQAKEQLIISFGKEDSAAGSQFFCTSCLIYMPTLITSGNGFRFIDNAGGYSCHRLPLIVDMKNQITYLIDMQTSLRSD